MELRWKRKDGFLNVLQFRTLKGYKLDETDPFAILHDPIFTEWQDVPEVIDGRVEWKNIPETVK